MPAPHRLASLWRAEPDQARAELQAALDATCGDVRAAAVAFDRHETVVHGWIRRWGLREWLEATWPAADRAKRRGQKGSEIRRAFARGYDVREIRGSWYAYLGSWRASEACATRESAWRAACEHSEREDSCR
jgi:hypothetical protein